MKIADNLALKRLLEAMTTQQQRASVALRLWSLTKTNKQNKTKQNKTTIFFFKGMLFIYYLFIFLAVLHLRFLSV